MVYPHAHAAPDNGRSEWDFGNLEVGVKWRFLNSGRLQMALAPYYVFGVKRGSAATGIGNNTDVMVFPVNAEYQINDMWRLNGELRYSSIEAGDDEWDYGAAVAYALDERWEYLFELSGTTDSDFDSDFLVARAGVDAAVTESLHLLFSIATGLREPSGQDELNYDLFFGFQFLH